MDSETIEKCPICGETEDVMHRKTLDTEPEELMCFSCWKMMLRLLEIVK